MKKLIVIRHGDYDFDLRLNEVGRAQVLGLARSILAHAEGSILILSSVALRALESAEIIQSVVGGQIEEHKVLWSERGHPEDFPSALKLVRERMESAGTIILVTHLEYAHDFPSYFLSEELNRSHGTIIVEKGEGVVIDYEKGEAAKITKTLP